MDNKILISKSKLQLILSDHSKEIGNNNEEIAEKAFAIIGFWVGTISYNGTGKILSLDIKTIFIVSSILYTAWALKMIFVMIRNPFDCNKLLSEIEDSSDLSKKYKWMSIAEMEKDSNIMDKNSDIIEFIKKSGY